MKTGNSGIGVFLALGLQLFCDAETARAPSSVTFCVLF